MIASTLQAISHRHVKTKKLIAPAKIMFIFLTAVVGLFLMISAWNYYNCLNDVDLNTLLASQCYHTLHYPKELEHFCLFIKVWRVIAIIGISVGFFHIVLSMITFYFIINYEKDSEKSALEDANGWKSYIATDCFVIWFYYKLITEHLLTFAFAYMVFTRKADEKSGNYSNYSKTEELAAADFAGFIFLACSLVMVILFVFEVLLATVVGIVYLINLKE